MIRSIIVENEPDSQNKIVQLLNRYFIDVELLSIVDNPLEASDFIKKNNVDLVFLNPNLANGKAIELLKKITHRNFKVICLSKDDRLAMKSMNAGVSYYLLKPIKKDEFVVGVNLVSEKIRNARRNNQLLIPSLGFDVPVPLADICYLESDGSYTIIYNFDEKILSSKNLGYFEKRLPHSDFKRVHHSFIVNRNKIKSFEKGRSGTIIMKNNKQVPVSQRKIKTFLAEYLK